MNFQILLLTLFMSLSYQQLLGQQSTKINNTSNHSQQNDTDLQIYGVRWSLGDYFAYSNLFKTHATYPNRRSGTLNTNYYTLAFNSQVKFEEDVFVEILSTVHTCSHRKIQIQLTDDHHQIEEIIGNGTSNLTISHIYRCYINVDLSKLQAQAVYEGVMSKDEGIWKEYPYKIYMQKPKFMYKQEGRQEKVEQIIKINRKVQTQKTVLFEGKFRAPIPVIIQSQSTDEKLNLNGKIQRNVLVLGDWGTVSDQTLKTKGYIPVLDSLLTKVQEDKSIILALFLGDLAYDMIGTKYREILKYLQPLSSRICFMVTPGNHDYIYHLDTFELFAETFLSPEWQKYYHFYYTFIFGDILFINYVPENVYGKQYETNVETINYMRNDLYNHYLKRVGSNKSQTPVIGSSDPIYKQYHVIVFSHYPAFCSKMNDSLESCEENRIKLKQYFEVFDDIGMDLYLAGHVHYYERTPAICWDTIRLKPIIQNYESKEGGYEVYSQKCPVYVIDGAAGNDYFEQPDGAVIPSDITSKIIFGTGFGLLSIHTQFPLNKQSSAKDDQLRYTHFRMLDINKTQITDQFIKKLPKLSQHEKGSKQDSTYIDSDLINARVMQMLGILFLVLIGSVVCFCFGRKYVRDFGQKSITKKKYGDHEEMVEQNLNSVISQGKNHQNIDKQSKGEQIH